MSRLVSGAQLCARFAYKPHHLGYCGPQEHKKVLSRCIIDGECKDFRHVVKKFPTLYSYLSLLSQKHRHDILDKDVVEAYWLGNDLVDSFTDKDFDKWVEIYTGILKKPQLKVLLRDMFHKYSIPFLPTHSFHVIFSFLLSQESGEYEIQRVNNCFIRSGEVVRFDKKYIILRSWKMEKIKRFMKIVSCNETIQYEKEFFPIISKGDNIAFHWNEGCVHITKTQQDRVLSFVKKLISCL